MDGIKVIRSIDIESKPFACAAGDRSQGWIKRILYPGSGIAKKLITGIAEVNPGYSPHRWHSHTTDQAEGFYEVFPEDFEQVYYVINGSGVIQSKSEDGKITQERVNAGDIIFFPPRIGEHQLLNNGAEKLLVLICGTPIPDIRFENR